MKLLSVVTAPPKAASYRSNPCSNSSYSSAINSKSKLGVSAPLLKVLSALTFLALPVAYVHAANTAENTEESTSAKKTVTSKEYRYNQPYIGAEQAAVNDKSDQVSEQESAKEAPPAPSQANAEALPTQPGNYESDAEANAVSTLSISNTSPIGSKQAARVEQHANTTKSSSDIVISSVNEFWIYDSWLSLQHDLDYDGYFSTFSVEFDADTIFVDAPVYAVLYLGQNGVYDAIHVSSEFFIYGEDSSDSFVIESTLVSGFQSYDYDILLELYDAQTEQLVAFSDGYDNAEFAFVPLESETNEYIVEDTVVIVEEHGGSMSWIALCFIISAAGLRIFKAGALRK
ncbi:MULTISPECIES: choice-of-anchor H family protein [unclassified Alteromonas]|uniref:choice-of-anchor H family protein n=1 Tax=unclassified Alteromonas TaxID=2614992 RepID=UPI000691084F|nr:MULTISPECIES: choice-of-anchor H family protein [unclassified Alteromonas]